MTVPADQPLLAFAGHRLLARGPAAEVVAGERPAAAVDLFAPTQAIDADAPERPFVIPSAATGRLVAPDAPTEAIGDRRPTSADGRAHQLTEPDGGDQASDRTMRNRFTTLEELHRATQAEATRARRREWVIRGIAAAAIGGLVVAGGSLLLRQPTADELHARIMATAADDEADLRDAGPLIDLFLERHASDPRAPQIQELDRTLELDALERRARRRPLGGRVLPPIERDYRAAMEREAESPAGCSAALDAVLHVHAHASEPGMPAAEHELWLALARRQIERLRPLVNRERAEDSARAKATLDQATAVANVAATTADPAKRTALEARRRDLLESVIEIYGERPHMADVVSRTKKLLSESQPAADSPLSPTP
jgi:hypothetical protein